MTPIKTKEFLTYLISTSISQNLVAFLINKPSLGLTDTPTDDQLLLRRNLTMVDAVAQEVSSNGYKRSIITFSSDGNLIVFSSNNIVYSTDNASISITSSFNNTIGVTTPVTHICYARGANLIGAQDSNGNNRGDTLGILIQVESVQNAPLTIPQNFTFTHTTQFAFNVSLL